MRHAYSVRLSGVIHICHMSLRSDPYLSHESVHEMQYVCDMHLFCYITHLIIVHQFVCSATICTFEAKINLFYSSLSLSWMDSNTLLGHVNKG